MSQDIAYLVGYASEVFKVLSDPTRLLIFIYLARKGEATIKDMAEALGRPENLISYHINLVKRLGIVKFRKSGKRVYYKLADENLKNIIELSLNLADRGDRSVKPRSLRFNLYRVLPKLGDPRS
ncbi:MAG: metalloregulator ArsR/SmtB family transcription factor [Thermoprotei archaeon]|nr:metalloregulator ArsR/SmtB family transcription factor [Thermoprotei archaeon]